MIGVCVLAALLLGAGAWALMRVRARAHDAAPASLAAVAPASDPATGSAEPTASVPATSAPSTTPSAPAVAPAPVPAATGALPLVAYRLGGKVWIAGEDGSAPKAMAGGEADGFSLSPSARTLLVIERSGGGFVFIDTESGVRKRVVAPTAFTGGDVAWLADEGVLCAQDDDHVMRVMRSGAVVRDLPRGTWPLLGASPDGRTVALSSPAEAGVRLTVDRHSVDVAAPGPTSVAVGASRVFVAYLKGGAPAILSAGLDGSGRRDVYGAPAGSVGGPWLDLTLSPDGSHLAVSEFGNDGYSRTYLMGADGGSSVALSARRDTTIRRWSADGAWLFYIDGNRYQGEKTSLWRVRADGTGRTLVVAGAE